MSERENAGGIFGALMDGLPHAKALGLRVVETAPDLAIIAAPYDARLVGDPGTGVVHGGVVTTLLDTACGLAVMVSRTKPASTATLDLRIEYMRAARPGATILARAHCHRATRSIAFVRAVAYLSDPDDPGDVVATASGAFMLERPGA